MFYKKTNRQYYVIYILVSLFTFFSITGCTEVKANDNGITPSVENDKKMQEEKTQAKKPAPKSIAGLRAREYTSGEIKVVTVVPSKQGLTTTVISYDSDGLTQYALVEKPAGEPPKEGWPILLLLHGHIPLDQYSTVQSYRSISEVYAANGFLVVKPDYRGHDDSETINKLSVTRTIDYSEDILNLLAGIDQISDGDVNNIFLFSHSMGGDIALRVMAVNRDKIKGKIRGATFWAAVTEDFPENTLYFLRLYGRAETKEYKEILAQTVSPDQYKAFSPLYFLKGVSTPVIIHHGTNDQTVPFEWSVSFKKGLDKAEIDYIFYEYPGDDHNIIANRRLVIQRDIDFFLQHKK